MFSPLKSELSRFNRTIYVFAFWVSSMAPVSLGFSQELTSLSQQEIKSETETIEKLLATQTKAWNRGSLESFMETYWKSEKLTFSAGGTTTRGWQSTLDRYKKRYATPVEMGQVQFDGLEIVLLESRTALVMGNWHLTKKDAAKRSGNYSLVMKKIEGEWKIVHDHSSELKAD